MAQLLCSTRNAEELWPRWPSAASVVLHDDADYERIADVTGQPHEWIVTLGAGHGSRPAI